MRAVDVNYCSHLTKTDVSADLASTCISIKYKAEYISFSISFILHLRKEHLLEADYVPGSVLSTRDIMINKTQSPVLCRL